MSKKSIERNEEEKFELALATVIIGQKNPSKRHQSRIKKARWHYYYRSLGNKTAREQTAKEALLIACKGNQKMFEAAFSIIISESKPSLSIIEKFTSLGQAIKEKLYKTSALQ